MSVELIVNTSLPETRIALMENGEIQELLIERAEGKGIVGNIYKGRVTRVLPGMQAAFVDIGLEKAAFLYVDDVFVHSDIWAEEEGEHHHHDEAGAEIAVAEGGAEGSSESEMQATGEGSSEGSDDESSQENDSGEYSEDEEERLADEAEEALNEHPELLSDEDAEAQMADNLAEEEDEEDEEGGDPVSMGREGGEDDENAGNRAPEGTISPKEDHGHDDDQGGDAGNDGDFDGGDDVQAEGAEGAQSAEGGNPAEGSGGDEQGRKRHRRGRRGGRNRRFGRDRDRGPKNPGAQQSEAGPDASMPESFQAQMSEAGDVVSDRASVSGEGGEGVPGLLLTGESRQGNDNKGRRPEFNQQRSRDRRIRSKQGGRPMRANVSIQDLLKEGQEVIVQIAKDPIATKGARLTCHISLPGRHLVCMPTIEHVGVSRRIERDDERRMLREYVERNRPKGLGFIVRTATSSGKHKAEARIKQDIDYLSTLWEGIKSKANSVQAPALVYEDLNPATRAIRDWVNEDIDKVVVDSRYLYNEICKFVQNFMPNILNKIEHYQGDVPIFDAYNISTELARALERKVWLKSGGSIVIDQAEALVAIDVNTGRYVGKKSLEDTILKTNLEAVKEIAYQLRLRNCGGIIILDLIDMEREENKFRVYRALEEELKKDRARPQILKISELGLIEMTRKRTRDTIVRALCDSCNHCEGKGFIKSKMTVAYEILRDIEREGIDREGNKLLIQAHPDVIDVLAIDERETLDQLERRYRKTLYLQAVLDMHPEQYSVASEKRTRGTKTDDQILDRARESAQTQDRGRRGRNNRNRGRGRDGNGGGGRDQNRDENRRNNRDGQQSRSRNPEPPREPGVNRIQPAAPGSNPNSFLPPKPAAAQPSGDYLQGDDSLGMLDDRQPNFGAPQSQSNSNYDPDMVGNSVNYVSPHSSQNSGGNMSPAEDDFMTEEDRQAYLRAQSVQDAAIAGLAAGAGPNGNQKRQGQGQGRWGGGKNNNNRGGQGGGGRGGPGGGRNDRGGRGGRRGRGRFQGGFRKDAQGPQGGGGGGINPVSAAPQSGGSGEGGGNGGGGGGSGGDSSTPPA